MARKCSFKKSSFTGHERVGPMSPQKMKSQEIQTKFGVYDDVPEYDMTLFK